MFSSPFERAVESKGRGVVKQYGFYSLGSIACHVASWKTPATKYTLETNPYRISHLGQEAAPQSHPQGPPLISSSHGSADVADCFKDIEIANPLVLPFPKHSPTLLFLAPIKWARLRGP